MLPFLISASTWPLPLHHSWPGSPPLVPQGFGAQRPPLWSPELGFQPGWKSSHWCFTENRQSWETCPPNCLTRGLSANQSPATCRSSASTVTLKASTWLVVNIHPLLALPFVALLLHPCSCVCLPGCLLLNCVLIPLFFEVSPSSSPPVSLLSSLPGSEWNGNSRLSIFHVSE